MKKILIFFFILGSLGIFRQAFGCSSDITVQMSASPDPVLVENDLTYKITVTNPYSIINKQVGCETGVSVIDTLPSNVTLKSVNVDDQTGSCQSPDSQHVNCNLMIPYIYGTNQSKSITIVVTTKNAGTLSNYVHIEPTQDSDGSNNNVSSSTTVVDALPPPPPSPPTCHINALASAGRGLMRGYELSWTGENGTSATLDDGIHVEAVSLPGKEHVRPMEETTYTLTVTGAAATCMADVTVTPQLPHPPAGRGKPE